MAAKSEFAYRILAKLRTYETAGERYAAAIGMIRTTEWPARDPEERVALIEQVLHALDEIDGK